MELYCGEYNLRRKAKTDLRAWEAMQEILINNSNLDHYESHMYLEKHGYTMPTLDCAKNVSLLDIMFKIYSPTN